MELLNQSSHETIFNTLFNPCAGHFFQEDHMICVGDVENGGKGACDVSY